jgi:hypothetical protein
MDIQDRRAQLVATNYDYKGLIGICINHIISRLNTHITTSFSVKQYMHQHWNIFKKYSGRKIDVLFFTHTNAAIDKYDHLRMHPANKKILGPDGFLYLSHYRWVRDDKTTFKIGLDRLDDATIRQLQMFTGARTHEFVLGCIDVSKIKDEYYDRLDYYWAQDTNMPVAAPSKTCPLCDRLDDRTTADKNVLCWEDIEFYIVSDPYGNGGRDRLAMTILLCFHKGHENHSTPIPFLFV